MKIVLLWLQTSQMRYKKKKNWRPKINIWCLYSAPYFWEDSSRWTWSLTISCLARSWDFGIFFLWQHIPPSSGIVDVSFMNPHFKLVLGFELTSSCLNAKYFIDWTITPSPLQGFVYVCVCVWKSWLWNYK